MNLLSSFLAAGIFVAASAPLLALDQATLESGWEWVRESPEDWQFEDDGSLRLRTQSGKIWGGRDDAKNVMVRKTPIGAGPASIEVTVALGNPVNKWEQAGLLVYIDDGQFVKFVVEHIDGEFYIALAREYEKKGELAAKMLTGPKRTGIYRLRFEVDGDKVKGLYKTDLDAEKWQTAGQVSLPAKLNRRFALFTQDGSPDDPRWATFRNLRVTEPTAAPGVSVTEDDDQVFIITPGLEAAVRKRGYVSGVYRQSFLDRKTGFRDPGFGLDIADFILEPGSDAAYREDLHENLVYDFNNLAHGKIAKRTIEGPQICTRARVLHPKIIRGKDFVAVTQQFVYNLAAPGYQTGSTWTQTLVFPAGERFFFSSQKIDSVNAGEAPALRIDMPGHVKHTNGDTFSEIYLSYHGRIPASAFTEDFPPDAKFRYRAGNETKIPERFIRAVHLRDHENGEDGPWLAGMTLDPSAVHEGWCHQRRYVCMIEEIGGSPVQAGESFGAAFIVGYFDGIDEMNEVYDRYAGHRGLGVSADGWTLTKLP